MLQGLDSLMQTKRPLSALIADVNVLPLQAVKLYTSAHLPYYKWYIILRSVGLYTSET